MSESIFNSDSVVTFLSMEIGRLFLPGSAGSFQMIPSQLADWIIYSFLELIKGKLEISGNALRDRPSVDFVSQTFQL